MKLFDLFTEDEFKAQVEAKMVKVTPHPSGRLFIANYTQMAQFTLELWNHVTDQCRGLIFDLDGDVVARGFRKFWNYSDLRHPETLPENFPTEPPIITRKMDGSLGVLYPFDNKWYVSTRGSFTSDQSLWASKWLDWRCPNLWPSGYTPLVEIIYPANQIVVKYNFSGLVLLALVNNETGEEMDYASLCGYGFINLISVVDSFDMPLATCVVEDNPNEEGYVAAWPRPGTTPLRVKIKYATYVTLHRLLTQTNAVTVWEMLRDGLDLTTLTKDVPAEFRGWIDGLEKRFLGEFKAIEDTALVAMLTYPGEKNLTDPADKKAFALYVTGSHENVAPIMFAMATGKQYAPIIWKQIRPRGDERPFKADIDG
jgi:RNA ligase